MNKQEERVINRAIKNITKKSVTKMMMAEVVLPPEKKKKKIPYSYVNMVLMEDVIGHLNTMVKELESIKRQSKKGK